MLKRQRRFRPELGFVADPGGEWGLHFHRHPLSSFTCLWYLTTSAHKYFIYKSKNECCMRSSFGSNYSFKTLVPISKHFLFSNSMFWWLHWRKRVDQDSRLPPDLPLSPRVFILDGNEKSRITPSFETRVGNLKKGTAMRVLRVFVIVFGIDLSLIVIERSAILLALRDIKNYSCRCPSRDLSKICHRL